MSLLVSEKELLQRCQRIEGLSFSQLAAQLNLYIPKHAPQRKGWTGLAIELALGTTAGNKSLPDFTHLGIELKTIPVSTGGRVAESTFITSIPLLSIHRQTWLTSPCYLKLKRVLWLPVEGDKSIPFEQRRVGRAFLWSPNDEEHAILANDWQELSLMIRTGKLSDISAKIGQYLQIRPKSANAKSLCYAFDEEGNRILTLPRGFYLRSSFTNSLVKNTC